MTITNEDFSGLRRVQDAGGSSIDPPLDQSWDDLTRLRWQAAVVREDSGVAVEVKPANYWRDGIKQDGVYSMRGAGQFMGALSFDDAWTFLNGVGFGAREAQQTPHNSTVSASPNPTQEGEA